MTLAVRDVAAHHDFYARVLGLEATVDGRFRCGASLLCRSNATHTPMAMRRCAASVIAT